MSAAIVKTVDGYRLEKIAHFLKGYGRIIDIRERTKANKKNVFGIYAGRVIKVHKTKNKGNEYGSHPVYGCLVLQTKALFNHAIQGLPFRVLLHGSNIAKLEALTKENNVIAILNPTFFKAFGENSLDVSPKNMVVWIFTGVKNMVQEVDDLPLGHDASSESESEFSVQSMNVNLQYRSKPVDIDQLNKSTSPSNSTMHQASTGDTLTRSPPIVEPNLSKSANKSVKKHHEALQDNRMASVSSHRESFCQTSLPNRSKEHFSARSLRPSPHFVSEESPKSCLNSYNFDIHDARQILVHLEEYHLLAKRCEVLRAYLDRVYEGGLKNCSFCNCKSVMELPACQSCVINKFIQKNAPLPSSLEKPTSKGRPNQHLFTEKSTTDRGTDPVDWKKPKLPETFGLMSQGVDPIDWRNESNLSDEYFRQVNTEMSQDDWVEQEKNILNNSPDQVSQRIIELSSERPVRNRRGLEHGKPAKHLGENKEGSLERPVDCNQKMSTKKKLKHNSLQDKAVTSTPHVDMGSSLKAAEKEDSLSPLPCGQDTVYGGDIEVEKPVSTFSLSCSKSALSADKNHAATSKSQPSGSRDLITTTKVGIQNKKQLKKKSSVLPVLNSNKPAVLTNFSEDMEDSDSSPSLSCSPIKKRKEHPDNHSEDDQPVKSKKKKLYEPADYISIVDSSLVDNEHSLLEPPIKISEVFSLQQCSSSESYSENKENKGSPGQCIPASESEERDFSEDIIGPSEEQEYEEQYSNVNHQTHSEKNNEDNAEGSKIGSKDISHQSGMCPKLPPLDKIPIIILLSSEESEQDPVTESVTLKGELENVEEKQPVSDMNSPETQVVVQRHKRSQTPQPQPEALNAQSNETQSDLKVQSPVPKETQSDLKVQSPVPNETQSDLKVQSPVPNETQSDLKVQSPVPNETQSDLKAQSPVPNETQSDLKVQSPVPNETQSDLKVQSPVPNETQSDLKAQSPVPNETQSVQSPVPNETQNDLTIQLPVPNETTNDLSVQSSVPNETQNDLKDQLLDPNETTNDLSVQSPVPNETQNDLRVQSPFSNASTAFEDAHSHVSAVQTKEPNKPWTMKPVGELHGYGQSIERIRQLNQSPTFSGELNLKPFQSFSIDGVIIGIEPDIGDNPFALIKGVCYEKCKQHYSYDDFVELGTMKTACVCCTSPIHFICPGCHLNGLQHPLCLFFSFDVHLFVGDDLVMRVECAFQSAIDFLSCTPATYLRCTSRAVRRIKSIIAKTPKFTNVYHLRAKIKPKLRKDVIYLTFDGTSVTKHLFLKGKHYHFPPIK